MQYRVVDEVLDPGSPGSVEGELADLYLVGAHVGTDVIDRTGGASCLVHGRAEAHVADDDILRAQGGDLLGLLWAMDQGPDGTSPSVEGPDDSLACFSGSTGDKNHGNLQS
jgi:hypothetical protein